MTAPDREITEAMQRYAAEIFRLQQDCEFVSPSLLELHLEISPQAVSRMLRRMRDAGLVEHEPYRGVRLTQAGEQVALPIIRRHRLAEVFLVEVMRFGWEETHDLADVFVNGLNAYLEERIDELTGHPDRCPHGEPIPTPDGTMPVLNDVCLVELEPGCTVRISRVRTHDVEKLRYLGELGLRPGTELDFVAAAPFNGPLRLCRGRREVVLGRELAATLWVEPV
ncbi:MAG: metal-dependent transcriptional regulator [Ardenticatenia bacterium]|nr:metal-dependent transcriptional regulator [Ardenticatenia bacterium]